MINCPKCNEENPPKFRLVRLLRGAPASLSRRRRRCRSREVRRTVTIVFCDLKGSTALGERLDTEALHEVKERYFTAMAAEITRHGGKIEKYIGDAIMAVFGLPRAARGRRAARRARRGRHAARRCAASTRTCRRATASRSPTAPASTPARWSPTTTRRADQKLATGDAVNVTARLEQAAPANEIYSARPLSAGARRGRGRGGRAARAEGQAASASPRTGWFGARGLDGNVRRSDTPIVGRDAELAAIDQALREVVGDAARARMVTVDRRRRHRQVAPGARGDRRVPAPSAARRARPLPAPTATASPSGRCARW